MDAETRAELTALRAEVAQLRSERGTPRRRLGTRGRRGTALVLALLLEGVRHLALTSVGAGTP